MKEERNKTLQQQSTDKYHRFQAVTLMLIFFYVLCKTTNFKDRHYSCRANPMLNSYWRSGATMLDLDSNLFELRGIILSSIYLETRRQSLLCRKPWVAMSGIRNSVCLLLGPVGLISSSKAKHFS